MARANLLFSTLLCAALVPGCLNSNPGDDTQGAATSTTSTTSGNQSGSVTSAPASEADGGTDSAPTMGTSTTTGSGTGGTTDQPCTFLDCRETEPMDGCGTCDPFAQDCPEGQKCIGYIADGGGAWNAVKCVDVTGADKPGEPCTSEGAVSGVDSCIEGAMCWGVDKEGVGTCVAQCTGSVEDAVCAAHSYCVVSDCAAINLCFPICNPLLQDCPYSYEACYAVDDSFDCSVEPNRASPSNEPCAFVNSCEKGLMCADAAVVGMGCPPGSTGCCTPFCQFPDGTCPNPDQQCVQYFDPMRLPANDPWLDIGFCGLPG